MVLGEAEGDVGMRFGFDGSSGAHLGVDVIADGGLGVGEERRDAAAVDFVGGGGSDAGKLKPGGDEVGILDEFVGADAGLDTVWPADDAGDLGAA